MYNVKFLLVCEDWTVRNIAVNSASLVLVYMSAIRMLKQRTGIGDLDLLPLGNHEFLLWGQGKCQGYLSIKEAGLTVLVPDSGSGR